MPAVSFQIALAASIAGATYDMRHAYREDVRLNRSSAVDRRADYRIGSEGAHASGLLALKRDDVLASQFAILTKQWQEATRYFSNAAAIADHPAYQKIIDMGPPVVRYILREMQQRPHHWFWALNIINQHDPVPEAHAGDIDAMTQDWLEWGRAQRII